MPRLSNNLNRLSVDFVDRSRSMDSSVRGFFLCLAALVLSVHFGAVQIAKGQAGSRARLAAEKLFAEGESLRKRAGSQSYEAAIKKYEAALPLWRAASDPRSEARTLMLIGELHNYLGKNQQALHFAQQSLSLSSSLKDQPGEAQALYLLGEVYYSLANFDQAVAYHKRASAIFEHLRDTKGVTQAQIGLGYDQSILGDTDSALASFQRALDLARATSDRPGEALAACALATQYSMVGEAQKAIALYDGALQFYRQTGDRFHEARTLNGLAYIYYQVGERERALLLYGQTLPIYQALGRREGEAGVRVNMGQIYDETGKTQQALEQFRIALSISKELSNTLMQSYALGYIGKAYDSLGDFDQALSNYKAALELNRRSGDRREEAYTLSDLGQVLWKKGEQVKAIEHYTEALALSRKVNDLRAASLALYKIARAERDRGNLDVARARVEEALQVSDKFRANVAAQEMRATYFATVHEHYQFYVDLLMRLHQQRPSEKFDIAAFEASERGRARSLLETLKEYGTDIRQGVDQKLLQRELDLQRRLRAKTERRIQSAVAKAPAEELDRADKELSDLSTELQQVQGQIRATSPRYAALVQPAPLTLKEIQQQVLDADTALLAYALGEDRSHLWLLTAESIKSFELPARTQIENSARRLYTYLTSRNQPQKNETPAQRRLRTTKDDAQYVDASRDLSTTLLGPVAKDLRHKRLVIVADGALQYVPFAALPAPSSTSRPLVADYEIVSLPSASVLALMREDLRTRPRAPKSVAILADPVFDEDDQRLAAVRNRRGDVAKNKTKPLDQTQQALRDFAGLSKGIARLPFSGREAEAIMALVPSGEGMLAVGFRASRATAVSPELSQYRYVHFATHGLLNSKHPELSGVFLSRFNELGQPQDGFLQLHDVYNLKLSADLVVLSACQTALGKDVRGEGLVGLTRGFMYAGAPRVVSSLWQVDDAATADFMREFYSAMLTEGKRPAEALRLAQLRMSKQTQWSSPYYWAAFTLQGEWR
jgi:CHAT domain-containing protein/tetratricopeptide (TPR) repeat protein